jgi:hypothetical protein
MIRRTFPELITNEIVGVQPMSGPVGLAFALRYKYESDPLGSTSPDGAYGATSNTPQGWTVPTDGVEAGYNYLNTRFTGTSASWLSGGATGVTGAELFTIPGNDQGVANLLANFELSSNKWLLLSKRQL